MQFAFHLVLFYLSISCPIQGTDFVDVSRFLFVLSMKQTG
jgi:hypothetical protein